MESELVCTENVVNALMEYLVDPYLPLKSSAEAPSLSQQHSVAKQLHAVVILYNYYWRKQTPQAQYFDFESFCKLAVTLKPTLVSYMKFINQCHPTGSNVMDNDLSITEKAIQDACNISCALDATKDVPSINKWLISKVSVFLLDSKKENCWLLYSSVTDGVWSLLERSLEQPTAETEGAVDCKHLNKKRRTSMRPVTVEQIDDDSGFQQLAFLAVKDATGICRSDLVMLEKHVVYSLSKEKTASCFYIMQCTQPINDDIQIPVKETFESCLQGPLVKRNSGSWSATEVVEYFHLLPYASIMSAFLLREVSNSLKVSNTRSNKDTLDNYEKEFSGTKISLFDQNFGNVDINSSKGSADACGVVVNDNNDVHNRNVNSADSFGAEVDANNSCQKNTGDPKDFDKGVQHENMNSYGSFRGEVKEVSGRKGSQSVEENIEKVEAKKRGEAKEVSDRKGSQSIEENIEKVEAKKLGESYEALIGINSDHINLEISKAKNSDGRRGIVSHSAVVQETTAADGPLNIRKSEDALIYKSIRSKDVVDFSGDKLTGVNLECLNDTRKYVGHENSRDYDVVIDRPRTPEEKADELVKSTKSCEFNEFSGAELAGAHPEPSEVHMNDDYQLSSCSSSPTRRHRMDIDASIPCSKNGNSGKDRRLITKVYQKKRTKENGGQIVERDVICRAERTDERKDGIECGLSTISPDRHGISVARTAVVAYKHESPDIGGDLQTVLASKEKALAQSALRALLHKREKLCHQRHKIEEEIALCDNSIQRILVDGKDNLALKLDTLLSFCDEMCLKDRAPIRGEDHQPDKDLGLLSIWKSC